ncbi:Keratin, type II cytoskeletal 8 [Plecturocebus cupreus]
MNQDISQFQSEIEGLTGQRSSLETTITDAEQCGELTVKDANAKLSKLEATLQWDMQDMAQ